MNMNTATMETTQIHNQKSNFAGGKKLRRVADNVALCDQLTKDTRLNKPTIADVGTEWSAFALSSDIFEA